MTPVTLLVASETRFVRGPEGRTYSSTGIDGYGFWLRYLEVFDRVLVAARVRSCAATRGLPAVDGPGVEVARLPDYHGPWQHLRRRAHLRRAMRAAIEAADVLCLRAPGPLAGLAWKLRGARPVGVEVVGDPHEALAPGAVRSGLRPLARAALRRQLRAMCAGATAVAYVTERVLRERYPTDAWTAVYSSIELSDEAFADDREIDARVVRAADPARGTKSDPWDIIFVGSLEQLYKGQDVLIDAVAFCRERGIHIRLRVVGEGKYRGLLEARAQARGVADAVEFTGRLPAGSTVLAALNRADLFVLPSRTEGLPRVMIEALARGLPCIGTRVGGIPELLDEPQLVPPGDALALAEKIIRLLTTPTALQELSRRGRDIAARYHRDVLRPRRTEFYARLRTAADARSLAGRVRRAPRGAVPVAAAASTT